MKISEKLELTKEKDFPTDSVTDANLEGKLVDLKKEGENLKEKDRNDWMWYFIGIVIGIIGVVILFNSFDGGSSDSAIFGIVLIVIGLIIELVTWFTGMSIWRKRGVNQKEQFAIEMQIAENNVEETKNELEKAQQSNDAEQIEKLEKKLQVDKDEIESIKTKKENALIRNIIIIIICIVVYLLSYCF